MSSWLLMFLLVLLILIHDAQGIRSISKGSVQSAGLHSLHNQEEKIEVIRSNEEGKSKKLSGSTRKLVTTIHSSSTTTNIPKNEKKHEETKEENLSVDSPPKTQQLQEPDLAMLDIAAMDYTLARRKPPIHN